MEDLFQKQFITKRLKSPLPKSAKTWKVTLNPT